MIVGNKRFTQVVHCSGTWGLPTWKNFGLLHTVSNHPRKDNLVGTGARCAHGAHRLRQLLSFRPPIQPTQKGTRQQQWHQKDSLGGRPHHPWKHAIHQVPWGRPDHQFQFQAWKTLRGMGMGSECGTRGGALERRRWYDQAKHDTMGRYADIKTSLLSYEKFERLRTDTELLLAHHMQQAQYTWLQQECIMQLMHETANGYQQKAALYWDASRQARQTIYLIRKRPREQCDPTLWEVPLQPLPKRQKSALGSKRVGNPSNMTTPTSTGKHGGPAMS